MNAYMRGFVEVHLHQDLIVATGTSPRIAGIDFSTMAARVQSTNHFNPIIPRVLTDNRCMRVNDAATTAAYSYWVYLRVDAFLHR